MIDTDTEDFSERMQSITSKCIFFLISAGPHAALTILRLKRHFLSPVTPVQYGEHSFMAWKVAGVFTNEWIQHLNCFPTSVCPLKRQSIQTSVVQSRGHWGLRALHPDKNTLSAASIKGAHQLVKEISWCVVCFLITPPPPPFILFPCNLLA